MMMTSHCGILASVCSSEEPQSSPSEHRLTVETTGTTPEGASGRVVGRSTSKMRRGQPASPPARQPASPPARQP